MLSALRTDMLSMPATFTVSPVRAARSANASLTEFPERTPLLTFPSTSTIFSLASLASEDDHYAYPEAFAQLTAALIAVGSRDALNAPPRTRRSKTTPDIRREHLTLLSTKFFPDDAGLVCSPSPTRHTEPPRKLSYEDMGEFQAMLRPSPSSHGVVVEVSDSDIQYTESPHRFFQSNAPIQAQPVSSHPAQPLSIPMPLFDSPVSDRTYRSYEAIEFAGWLKPRSSAGAPDVFTSTPPQLPPLEFSPQASEHSFSLLSYLAPESPEPSVTQTPTASAALSRTPAVRRQNRPRKATPTTLHWAEAARSSDTSAESSCSNTAHPEHVKELPTQPSTLLHSRLRSPLPSSARTSPSQSPKRKSGMRFLPELSPSESASSRKTSPTHSLRSSSPASPNHLFKYNRLPSPMAHSRSRMGNLIGNMMSSIGLSSKL